MTQPNENQMRDEHQVHVLADLMNTIEQRSTHSGDTSYTAKLLDAGKDHCAKKFGEEAFEIALASVGSDKKHIVSEAGDVLYHLLVLLKSCDVKLSDVMTELSTRTGQSGLQEKASRAVK